MALTDNKINDEIIDLNIDGIKKQRFRINGDPDSIIELNLSDLNIRERLEKGIDIGGFVTSPADVHLLKHDRNSTLAEIVIHEGKNRQVRRMFKAIGHPVLELCRTGLGNLEIGRLAVGQCRKLSPAEVEQLKRI